MSTNSLGIARILNSIRWRLASLNSKRVQILESRNFKRELSFEEILHSNFSRNDLYRYFQKSFRAWTPDWIRSHRSYFANNKRGFGEDAFHAAWYLIIRTFKPVRMLEVGVYRGQTISLWALISSNMNHRFEILGITPMNSSGDDVSNYITLDYKEDIKNNFKHFGLGPVDLLQAFSTDLLAKKTISSGDWDLVYIDGSHDYEVVKSDFAAATEGLKSGGILVLDDSSLLTDFNVSTREAFRGHPGPSRVFSEINPEQYEFLFGVGHNNFLRKK
jgi:predicted O-methyltransferase YrrM